MGGFVTPGIYTKKEIGEENSKWRTANQYKRYLAKAKNLIFPGLYVTVNIPGYSSDDHKPKKMKFKVVDVHKDYVLGESVTAGHYLRQILWDDIVREMYYV